MDLLRIATRIATTPAEDLKSYLPGLLEYLKTEREVASTEDNHLMYDDDAAESISAQGFDFRKWHTDEIPGISEFVEAGLIPSEFQLTLVEKGVWSFSAAS